MNRRHAISRHLAFCAVAGKEIEPDAVRSDVGQSHNMRRHSSWLLTRICKTTNCVKRPTNFLQVSLSLFHVSSGAHRFVAEREYEQLYSSLTLQNRVVKLCTGTSNVKQDKQCAVMYTRVNKNPSAWNFLSPKPEVTCGTVAIIIRVVLLSTYLRIRAVSLSSIHYNQSHRVYINRRRQYICLLWN